MIKLPSFIQMNTEKTPRAIRLRKRNKQRLQGQNGKKKRKKKVQRLPTKEVGIQ